MSEVIDWNMIVRWNNNSQGILHRKMKATEVCMQEQYDEKYLIDWMGKRRLKKLEEWKYEKYDKIL